MNEKLKETINEAADKLRGMDSVIPPIPSKEQDYQMKMAAAQMNTYNVGISDKNEVAEEWVVKEPYLFTEGFIDCALALCFCGSLICAGMAFRGL